MEVIIDGVEYEMRRRGGGSSSVCVDGTWYVPKPKRHTFGGMVFEETGEYRLARRNEWWLGSLGPCCEGCDPSTLNPHPILRPVALEGAC